MKFFAICLLALLVSCANPDNREIEQLNQRTNKLEQRLDSLSNARGSHYPVSLYDTYNSNDRQPVSRGLVEKANRCQAITRKGTQCKRTASDGSYCWQHGR